jgi:triosephosphate isomerase (TIM)
VNFLEYSERFTLRVAFLKGIFTNAGVAMKYILGNWKMFGVRAEARLLAAAVAKQQTAAQAVLFPPFPLLPIVEETLKGTRTAWGAQDVSPEGNGAFTGDVSAAMLREAGCVYVITEDRAP